MKKNNYILIAGMAVSLSGIFSPVTYAADKVTGWGDFKLYIDPGHEGTSNRGLWNYSEAEKVLDVALNIKQMLETTTDMPAENLKLCRYTQEDIKGLEERSDEANAWGADFYYSIHSDAGTTENKIVTLFGGWRKDGVDIEKTPNGGKRYGDILEPNLSGVMRIGSRGNWYDRCFYDKGATTHANQYPYLSVNRRSNMPSLLSEGGYHTIASQQQRNLNGDYRRLEALAAFQSLLEYHGMERPDMTFLHGVVTNSENDQPINGATVTVDGKKYTTDTYESLFHKYSNNPNLIHNGLYTFEGLEAGKEYTVTFEAPGFETKTATVTIKNGGSKTVDYVTYLDVALTNTAPAKIDAVSVENPTSVSPLYPIEITFSRNMDRESVEKAFSINNDGEVELKWINDYTLSLDISNLLPLWDYTITIDGSIAKNSQTNQLFDGDGDGQPGGNWTYEFTMAEPDVTAPVVVSTFPANDSEVQIYSKFPIRFEFDEILNWNDDKDADCITVIDSDRNEIKGKVVHAIVREQSVVHFYADEAYPKDKTILATIAPGLTDLSGNVTAEPTSIRFMTEYRPIETTVVQQCNDETGFWAPGGSGSSSGLVTDECSTTSMAVNPFTASGSSMSMNYVFDEANATENWFVRLYTPNTNQYYSKDYNVVLSYWMYSDGSNNTMNMMIRIPNSSGGLKAKAEGMPLNFRGWNLFTWDLMNDEYSHFTGDQEMGASGNWRFDSFTMKHEYTDPDDEDIEQQAWAGSVGLHEFAAHKIGEAERQAKLDDITTSVEDVTVENLKVNVGVNMITIVSDCKVLSATVTAVNGMSVANAKGSDTILTVPTSSLVPGVYVVNVVTEEGTKTVKFVK